MQFVQVNAQTNDLLDWYEDQIQEIINRFLVQVYYCQARWGKQWEYHWAKKLPAWCKYQGKQVFVVGEDHLEVCTDSVPGFARSVDIHVDPYDHTSEELLAEINKNDKVILVRTDTYMTKAQTLGKFRFYNGDELVKVRYTFPVLKKTFQMWQETNGSGHEWYVVDLGEYAHAYALPFQVTNDLLTGKNCYFRKFEDVVLEPFDASKHRITVSNYTSYCWCGCGQESGYRTDFDLNWEVVLSDRPIDRILFEASK